MSGGELYVKPPNIACFGRPIDIAFSLISVAILCSKALKPTLLIATCFKSVIIFLVLVLFVAAVAHGSSSGGGLFDGGAVPLPPPPPPPVGG